jgi:hypothetical protein
VFEGVPGGVPLAGEEPSRTKKPVTRVASILLCRPETGQPTKLRTAKMYFSRKARKKTGTATPMSETTTLALSKKDARRRAAR